MSCSWPKISRPTAPAMQSKSIRRQRERFSPLFAIFARGNKAQPMRWSTLVVRNASALVSWGTSAGAIALAVLAPVGLLVLGDGARRLRGLWKAMHRIARNDIAHPVPSLRDVDEIGDMARAVQVFKENAITLADQRGEIEQINRFLDIALNNMARGLSMFDAERRLVICNESYRALYDLPHALTARGTPWSD